MKKIIILPGTADAIFFINEIEYISRNFDKIVVISYPGNENNFSAIAKEKGFDYRVVKNNIWKTLIDIKFYKWLLNKNTVKEIRNIFLLSKQGLTKLGYIFYYGLFYINAKKIIDKEVKALNDKIFLYSFWLTRGAYTIANYNNYRKKNLIKIISRAHGYDLYEERNKTNYLPFRDFIDTNIDEIHFISNHGLKYFMQKYKRNNLSSKKFISRLGTFNSNMVTKKINLKNKVCIASCSLIIPEKRLDLIIDIIANINVPVEWIHIGTGNQIKQMKLYAEQRIVEKEYHFLGQLNNSEILAVYEKYDVDFFLNMSDSEGVPVSIMEAMSMGIPTIARNVGGINEIVNMNNGLLIENINNMELVYNLVNKEVRQRIWEVDIYQAKLQECRLMWDEKYNAAKNYTNFFTKLTN